MLYRLDRSNPNQPQLVAVEHLTYDAPRRRVIVLPGGGVYFKLGKGEAYRRSVAGTIKYVEQAMMPLGARSTPPVDVYLYVYEGDTKEAMGWTRAHGLNQKTPHPEFDRDFGQEVLMRAILKPKESLSTLNKAEIKRRISSITLVGHSMGTALVQMAADGLVAQLRALGWNEADVGEVARELVTISVASIARQDAAQPTATQFFFTADNDMPARKGVENRASDAAGKAAMREVCGYGALPPHEEGKLLPLAPNCYRVRATLPSAVSWQERDKNGTMVTRTISNETLTGIDVVEHDFRGFLYGHPQVGRHLRNVLLNAATRDVGVGDGHALALQHALNHPPQPNATTPRQRAA